MEHLMTSEEIAEYLHVDPVTIRRLVGKGELAAYRIGADYRFAPSDIEAYLQRQRIAGGEEFSDNPFDESEAPDYFKWFKLPFDRFSEQAKRVLSEAQSEAQRFQHSYIGTEHLLLGIIDAGESAATQMLKKLEVEPERVREMVGSIIGQSRNARDKEINGLTKRTGKVLMLALEEMKRFHQRSVGPEHLLLALAHPGTGIAAEVLEQLGADLKHMYMQMKHMLGEQQKAPPLPVPEEAASLLGEDAEGRICKRCDARSPAYFRYCFNCGAQLWGE